MASLQSRLDDFKKTFESGAPPHNAQHEAIKKMHRATADLKASGLEQQALKIGDRAPSFALFNQDHVQVVSKDLLREGPLEVSFFPGTLVTLLQHGAGGSTRNQFRSPSIQSLRCRITCAIFTSRSVMHWTGSTMRRGTDCRYLHATWSTSKGSSGQPM
jgi:hypothetical protein